MCRHGVIETIASSQGSYGTRKVPATLGAGDLRSVVAARSGDLHRAGDLRRAKKLRVSEKLAYVVSFATYVLSFVTGFPQRGDFLDEFSALSAPFLETKLRGKPRIAVIRTSSRDLEIVRNGRVLPLSPIASDTLIES